GRAFTSSIVPTPGTSLQTFYQDRAPHTRVRTCPTIATLRARCAQRSRRRAAGKPRAERARMRTRILGTRLLIATLLAAGCGGPPTIEGGQSIIRIEEGLTGCHGVASSAVPSSGDYYLTTFGVTAGVDDGEMSCTTYTKHGSWYYAASRQRYGCFTHVKIEA